jgi:hypothetical protein
MPSKTETNPVRRAWLNDLALMGSNQRRLYNGKIYTDDGAFLVNGAQRTARLLGTWGRLTAEIGVLMAVPEKRSIG